MKLEDLSPPFSPVFVFSPCFPHFYHKRVGNFKPIFTNGEKKTKTNSEFSLGSSQLKTVALPPRYLGGFKSLDLWGVSSLWSSAIHTGSFLKALWQPFTQPQTFEMVVCIVGDISSSKGYRYIYDAFHPNHTNKLTKKENNFYNFSSVRYSCILHFRTQQRPTPYIWACPRCSHAEARPPTWSVGYPPRRRQNVEPHAQQHPWNPWRSYQGGSLRGC